MMKFTPREVTSQGHEPRVIYKKKSESVELALSKFGIDLLSHPGAVPSALTGLTSLFGMGRGGSPSL